MFKNAIRIRTIIIKNTKEVTVSSNFNLSPHNFQHIIKCVYKTDNNLIV